MRSGTGNHNGTNRPFGCCIRDGFRNLPESGMRKSIAFIWVMQRNYCQIVSNFLLYELLGLLFGHYVHS